jgi:hypothetical protein
MKRKCQIPLKKKELNEIFNFIIKKDTEMNNIILTIPVFFIILAMINFFHNYKKSKIINKNIGKIYVKWSCSLNLSFWQSWIKLGILFFGLILVLHWAIFAIDQNYGYAYIIIFLFTMSYYFRWIIKFGTNGIMIKLNLLYWKDVSTLTVIEIKSMDSRLTEKLKVPPKLVAELNRHLTILKNEGKLKQYKLIEN